MTPQQLLNADLSTIGRWIRQGLAWWGRELADLLPPALRDRPGRRARLLAEMTTLEGSIRLWRDGVLDGTIDAPSATIRPADLLAPADAVLVRELDLPRLSAADLNRLITLNLDRYTPFATEQVYFDTVQGDRIGDGTKQKVLLGVLTRTRGRILLERANALGVKVERLGIGVGADGRTLQFDFMRAIRDEEGGDPTRRRRTYLWIACGVLLAANVLIAVLRDGNDVAQVQRLVDAQQPTVQLATRLRKTVETERARRLGLLARRSIHEPLRIVDAVTRALPPGQWVQRLEWNGRAVRLVGLRKPDFDVLAALRSPALTAPRSLLSDMPTKSAQGDVPFDVMADASGERSPERRSGRTGATR